MAASTQPPSISLPLSSSTPPSTSSTASHSTTTSSSTSPSSSSTTSSSTTSTTTSSTTSQTSSSTSLTTTSSNSQSSTTTTPLPSTTSLLVQTSNGRVFTSTIVTVPASSTTVTPAQKNTASKSFFQNTGAVAGTFAAVGVVALVLVVWLVTAAYRRRRAKLFDADVAEAAAEAAASSRSPDFEEYHDYSSGHGGGGGGGMGGMYNYQEASHGSLAQAPLAHEAYGMSEFNGGQYDYNGIAPGVGAGVGAGAVNLRPGEVYRQPPSDPYAAHAVPPQPDPRFRAPVGQGYPGWEEAGLGGGGYAVARALSISQQNGPLARTRSPGAATVLSQSTQSQYSETDNYHSQPHMQVESYANHYRDIDHPHEDAYSGVASAIPAPLMAAAPAEDALPNPFAGDADSSEGHGSGRRALKIANN